MIIYSVTISLEEEVKEQWLDFMKNEHIAAVMATNCFTGYRLTHVIGTSEEKRNSFNIQYYANSMADMHRYQAHFAAKLQREHGEKFGSNSLAFRTLLEDI